MSNQLWSELSDRGVISVSGEDAATFLQGLLTADMANLRAGSAMFAALLTPQGKILFDGIVSASKDGFLIDCRRDMAGEFARRLGFYKMRAKVVVADKSDELCVVATWPGMEIELGDSLPDPRGSELGYRVIIARSQLEDWVKQFGSRHGSIENYHAHRIEMGIPEGGLDFESGELFPHEANMDRLGGLSFTKGCYIGQEVVSRMQHRGTARSRIVPVLFPAGSRPEPKSEIVAGGRRIGQLGSSTSGRGLALLRIDRLRAAQEAREAIKAGAATLTAEIPDWVLPVSADAGRQDADPQR